jgi:hypothetical protein
MLLVGGPDEATRADLEAAPLREATRARIVPCDVLRDDAGISLVPRAALAPGGDYTVALGGWARDGEGRRVAGGVMLAELRAADDATAGAAAIASWPADGTAGVPIALPLAAVRFDGRVEGLELGVWLETSEGTRVPAAVRRASCGEVGWDGVDCVVVTPLVPLREATGYVLRTGGTLRDALGAEVEPWSAAFTTGGSEDAEPPGWVELGCALDEAPAPFGCLLVDDRSVTVRLRASEPARVFLETSEGIAMAVATRGDASLRLRGIPPAREVTGSIRALGMGGAMRVERIAVRTSRALAPVWITEVRADPRGPEPRQEYVEIHNAGPVPLDLDGYALSDRGDVPGDVVAGPPLVPPGARALIVGDAFDPVAPEDDPVPPGVVLIRIGTSIGSAGLSATGEPLYLRDPEGRRLSSVPAVAARPGECLVRIGPDGRDPSPTSFTIGPCTPGEEP